MKSLRSKKFCAALVMITWLLSLVSIWGIQDAGRRATAGLKGCVAKDLEGLGVQLELAKSPDDALRLFEGGPNGNAGREDCLRSGVAAGVAADYLFIPAYSALTLALFLFVRSFWIAPPRERKAIGWMLLATGLIVSLAMAAGDVLENRQLMSMLDFAGPVPQSLLTGLRIAGSLKWGALAASAFLLALAWSKAPFRLHWVLRLAGLAAAALFITGLVRPDPDIVNAGIIALTAFWLAALIHAIAAAAEPAWSQT